MMISTIAIASYGGEDVAPFIARINKLSGKNVPQFECTDYVNTGDRVLVLQLALSSHKERNLPLILLINRKFLDSVWSSTSKGQILKTILTYSTKCCVHIWFDNLTESDVEKYSVGLCRSDSAFRRISYSDLPVNDNEMLERLLSLLQDTQEKISFENYSVQEEIQSNSTTDFVTTISPSNLVFTDDVLSNPNFNKNEAKSLPVQPSSSSSGSISNNKKRNTKRNRKAGAGNHYLTASASMSEHLLTGKPKLRLSDISKEDRLKITNLLDVGFGVNWKQIAAYYELTGTEIQNIEIRAHTTSVGPSEILFQILETRIPDLDVADIQNKCKKIARNDVAQEIANIISMHKK